MSVELVVPMDDSTSASWRNVVGSGTEGASATVELAMSQRSKGRGRGVVGSDPRCMAFYTVTNYRDKVSLSSPKDVAIPVRAEYVYALFRDCDDDNNPGY